MMALATIFITSTKSSFAHELELIRATTQGNQLLTGTYANFGLPVYRKAINDTTLVVDIVPGSFRRSDGSLCFCARDSTCMRLMGIYNVTLNPRKIVLVHNITSFYFGCMLIDSVLRSTLECFFDDSECLKYMLHYFTDDTSSLNITALSTAQTSQFQSNTTVGVLLQNLFVEEWTTNISYASYFAACAPETCSYTYTERNSLLHVVTTLLGLYGGLTIVLRLIVSHLIPFVIKKSRKCYRQRSLSIVPDAANQATSE